jgi:hypothetical protein
MGVRASTFIHPKDPPPPRRQEDDYPLLDPIGIGKGMAQGCEWKGNGVCQLAVPQGVSSSGAKLYRDEGTIRRDQCRKYARDLQKVSKNEKSFEEVKRDLIAGLYYEELPNQYCRQIVYAAEDLKTVLTPDKLPLDKVRYMTIREMSDSGSYSSVTKLFIKPAIPFEIEFNGKPHKITVMTLLHPSPIRMENIQHDAMLTLGDPGKGNNDGLVVLIPLQGAIVAGPSGAFLNKVVRYLTGVLQPDPATGDYKTIDAPTGNDWDLSKMFPGTPGEGGKTFVSNVGYYVWSGYPPLELRPDGTASASTLRLWWQWASNTWYLREPGVQRYAWQPSGTTPVRYVMLSKPALVSSMDLQTIRMLPVTPVTEAVAPILKHTLSYRGADSCPAPLPSAGAITDLFSRPVREGLENQCDPFAPGSFPEPNGVDGLVQVAIVFITTLGVGIAIYLAVLFFTKTKWGQWVAHQGTLAGTKVSQSFVADTRKLIPPDRRFEVSDAQVEAEAKAEAKKKADEEARVKKEEEADAKRKASLATFKATPKRPTTAPVTPEDVVVEPKLPSPGTPAAAAVAAAEPQESRAEMYRRRAKEVAAKVKADADKPPAQPEETAPEAAPPKEDTEAAERNKRWAETTVAEFKKAEARLQEAKEDAEEAKTRARKAEEAADDAKLEAEELAKKPKPRTGSFAAPTTGPTPLEVAMAKKEAAKQAAEAKRAAEEAAAKEADIKRLSEEAAKRASAAAERQVKNVPKPATPSLADPVFRQDNPMLKNKAFAKAAPSPSTIQAETRALATKVKEVQAAGKPPSALSAAQEAALTDDVMKESEERLKPLRTKTSGDLADAMRAANALSEKALRKNWPVWLRFEKEKTFHKSSISPLLQSFTAYSTALEASKLDRLKRAEYTTVLTKFRDSILRLLEASKTRLETIEEGAPDARVVKGGRRRRQRKSTRRYVA